MPEASYQFEDFGIELRWAAASMRGSTGTNDVKPNQDAASCTAPLGPYASTAFFGVFDGHGDGGEKPAAYAAQRVSTSLCTLCVSEGRVGKARIVQHSYSGARCICARAPDCGHIASSPMASKMFTSPMFASYITMWNP